MELQDVLKEIFAPLMEDMLKGELDAHLGYHEYVARVEHSRRSELNTCVALN